MLGSRIIPRVIVSCALFFLGCASLLAQHFINDRTGVFLNSTGAILRFRTANGELRNENPTPPEVRNNGTIEFLGITNRFTGGAALGVLESLRIGGLVRYASTSATETQQVQARWYSNLALAGSAAKRLPDAIYVGGETAQTGVFTASGGFRSYSGTFFYDNLEAQTLLGGEDYQHIEIARGRAPKRISEGTSVRTRGSFRQNASNNAGLQVYGSLEIGTDGLFPKTTSSAGHIEIGTTSGVSVHSTLSAQMLINAGSLNVGVQELRVYAGLLATRLGAASMLIETNSTLRLYAPNASTSGSLRLSAAGNVLTVSGTMRNDLPSGTNASFHPESTVRYNSSTTQSLMPTSLTHPYGNLTLETSDKTVQPLFGQQTATQANIAILGTLRVQSSLVDMGNGELTMLNPSTQALFTGFAEVQGAMRRFLSSTIQTYTFNNAATRFTRTSGALPRTMTLTILPRQEPAVYEAQRDVRRRLRWEWAQSDSSTNLWTGALRLAYRREEVQPPFQAVNEPSLGMFSLPSGDAIPTPRRLGALGVERGLSSSTGFGFVEYRRLTNQMGTALSFVSGDELLLRGGRELVQSVQDGRWSNPSTWNIGREPDAEDSVKITHTIHIGFRRNALDGRNPFGQVRERGAAIGKMLAQSLVIAPPPDTTRRAALLIGSFPTNDSTFADELPPVNGRWNLTSLHIHAHLISSTASQTARERSSRLALQELRNNAPPMQQGLTVFAPASTRDSTRLRLQQVWNEGLITNGGQIDVLDNLTSLGFFANSGAVSSFAPENVLAQDSIGSWVNIAGDVRGRIQAVPSLSYSNLALSGQSRKQLIPQTTKPFIVHDSLQTSRDAVFEVVSGAPIEARGGVFHDGTILSASRDALLRLRGTKTQFLRGIGNIDILSIENGQGIAPISGSFFLQSALHLIRGEFRTSRTANISLADNAVIMRFPESSLAEKPIAQSRLRVHTRGNGVMTASGELLPRLSVLDVRNRGGYVLTENLRLDDSLLVASRLWTERSEGSYNLTFQPIDHTRNPQFLEDSAEIVGTVRRTIPPDTLLRLFNNRYTTLQISTSGTATAMLQASFRILPERFPSPNADTNKVWRGVEISVASENTPPERIMTRIGYAWRTESRDETNNLEAPRILLQRWNNETRQWQTSGTPSRATLRSRWNSASEEGFWQYGAMDSVVFSSASSRFFALGVDSTRTIVPSIFFTMQAFLEGAYLGERRMKTYLRDDNLLPQAIDETELPAVSGALAERILGEKSFSRAVPANAVDWLLLELRPAADGVTADSLRFFLPAMLHGDGIVRGTNRQSALTLELPERFGSNERFFAILHHRNHLPVQWRDTLELSPQRRFMLDWSDTAHVLGGASTLRRFESGNSAAPVFTLIAGNVSDESHESAVITRFDYDAALNSAWQVIFRDGYVRGDADMDGLVTTRDANTIWNNRGKRRVK